LRYYFFPAMDFSYCHFIFYEPNINLMLHVLCVARLYL
jgi:hypothetical protein